MAEHKLSPDRSPNGADELGKLLVSLVLGDASEVELDLLNDLLQRDVVRRRFAAQFLTDEAVLRHQFEMLGRVGEYHTPLRSRTGQMDCTLAELANKDELAGRNERSSRGPVLLLLASVLVVSLIGGAWWLGRGPRAGGSYPATADVRSHQVSADPLAESMAVKRFGALPRVERVSWAGPQFAAELEPELTAGPMPRGIVPFASADGRDAEGYMVELRPGALLELVVTADADAENALAVTEFDSRGVPTGRKMSFTNNYGESTATLALRGDGQSGVRYGPLGNWAERNNSSESRYYFFTCVHKHVVQLRDITWHVSRMSVLVDEPELVHIGWDDSGLMRMDEGELVPDDDFDDLCATIRVFDPSVPAASAGRLRILSHPGTGQAGVDAADRADTEDGRGALDWQDLVPDGPERGFELSVAAHETLILKVNNRASVPVSIAVLDKQTGGTKWRCEHLEPRLANTGSCVIENGTSEPRQFLLVGRYKASSSNRAQDWLPAAFSVLFDQDTFETVQLHVGQDDVELINMVKVDMLKLSNP